MAIGGGDGSIILTTKVDTDGLQDGLDNVKDKVSGVGKQSQKTSKTTKSAFDDVEKKISAVGVAIAAALIATLVKATKEIINFSKEASKVAMEAQASVLRLADIYGEASNAVGDFIDQNATALGMSKAAAASFASVYGNLFSVWADQATNAELTNAYLNMTAVVASKTGRTVEDVQERIRSGLLGNTEAIEDLGIFVNIKTIEITDAFQRMANGKSWEQLDAYTQQQIRTMAILEQATQKYGDEVATTAVLSQSRLSGAWQDFQATWGKAVNVVLIPILETVTKIIQVATIGLEALFGYSGNILEDVEKTSSSIEKETKNQKKLTDEMKKTEKVQEGILASFDDVEILSSSSSAFADGLDQNQQGGFTLDFELSGGENKVVEELTVFKTKCEEILEPLKVSLSEVFGGLNSSFEDAYENVLVPFSGWFETEFAPQFVNDLADKVDKLGNEVEELSDNLFSLGNSDISKLLQDLMTFVGDYVLLIVDTVNAILGLINMSFDSITPILRFIVGVLTDMTILGALMTYKGLLVGLIAIIVNLGGAIRWLVQYWVDVFGLIFALLAGDTEKAETHFERILVSIANFWISILNILIAVVNYVWIEFGGLIAGAINIIGRFGELVGDMLGQDWNLTFDLSKFPSIPYVDTLPLPKLAQGTVVPPNREFMAILGDNTKEPEVVSPVSTMKQAFMEAMIEMGGAGQTTKEEHYYLGETELMSILYKLVRGGERLRGESLISGGVY